MKTSQLNQSLDKAITALKNIPLDKIQQLSLRDCALVLDALSDVTDAASVRTQIAERLYLQLNPAWIRNGDLFEVFCVLTALWKYDLTRVTGDHLTYAVQRLVASEASVGGPYYSKGEVVGVTVNLQIASFVRLVAQPLPNIDAFFDHIIATGDVNDTDLSTPYALHSFTKMYNNPIITHYITKCRTYTPGYRAVALRNTKSNTRVMQQEVSALCDEQLATGFWKGEPLVRGLVKSHIVTTAFIVGILSEYQVNSVAMSPSLTLLHRHQAVTKAAKQLFDTCSEPLRSLMLAAIKRVCSSESGHEITLISYLFANALIDPPKLTNQQYITLGSASVCGWVAYTIYDDFLDGDGVPAQLPAANAAMRASLDCFRAALPERTDFETYVAEVFINMDEANAWEVSNCRLNIRDETVTIGQLPDYGKCTVLADRSFAHALGPIAVLMQHTQITPKEFGHIESGFRHYLIARQLCDDILDWLEDIQSGQASYVVTAILGDMHVRPGSYPLSSLISDMQKQFRRTTMPHVCKLALSHVNQARQSFTEHGHMKANSFSTLFDKLELSMRESLDQYEKARTFMKN